MSPKVARIPQQPDIHNRTLFINDNYLVMQGMENEIVDFIYLDPPFNSQRMYINALNRVEVKTEQMFDDYWRMDKIKAEYAASRCAVGALMVSCSSRSSPVVRHCWRTRCT